MFDLNRYDFISIQFCGCPQTLWRSDAGNFPIRSHLVRLREIMSRNACHDVHRGSFFRFGTVSISSCTDCILDAEYEAISFSLRTRSEEMNYRLITNRFLGWKGYINTRLTSNLAGVHKTARRTNWTVWIVQIALRLYGCRTGSEPSNFVVQTRFPECSIWTVTISYLIISMGVPKHCGDQMPATSRSDHIWCVYEK